MMGLSDLLREHQSAIARRWQEDVLRTYSEEAVVAFGRERDRFANPVGHRVREAADAVVQDLLDERDPDTMVRHFAEVIRIRAVQQFTAAEAVGFVLRLKDIIRAELGPPNEHPAAAAAWDDLDRRIDRLALSAFDVYTRCREEVYELRMNEVKRQVSWVLDRMRRREDESDAPPTDGEEHSSGVAMRGGDTP